MKYLKSLSRVSKSKISLLFNQFKSDVEVIETITKKDTIFELCSDEYDLIDYSKKECSFSYSFNGISTDKFELTLSKSMIKTYIYLHFIPGNRSGVRKNISFSNLADSLGLSVVSVRNNINRLVKLGFLWTTKVDRGLYDIVIVDEYKNHEINGEGYITLSYNMLQHLLSFDNVNELKVELKKLVWCDAKVNFTAAKITFNKNNLLSVLPGYMRKSKKEEILNSSNSLFALENGTLNYNAFETKKDIIDPLYKAHKEVIEGFFELSQMPYSKTHSISPIMTRELEMAKALILDDLVGLAIQYNIHLVLKALQDMYANNGGVNKNETKDPGRYVRFKIQEYIALNAI